MTKSEKIYSDGVKAFFLAGKFYDLFSGSEITEYQGLFCLNGHIDQVMETWIDNSERHYKTT